MLKTRRLITSSILLFPWLSKLSHAITNSIQIAPYAFPFDASKAGNILDVNFEIKKLMPWIFALQTDYSPENKQKVMKLAAGELNVVDLSVKRTEIPIKIKIYSQEGSLLKEKLVKTIKPYAQGFESAVNKEKGSGKFSRWIIQEKLNPGIYRLQVEMMQDTPELVDIKTFISIELQYIK